METARISMVSGGKAQAGARTSGRRAKKRLLWIARVLRSGAEISRGIMGAPSNFQPAFFVFPFEGRLVNAIHSFFCPRFDAVFLDDEMRVVDVRQVKPFWPFVVPRSSCKYLIEAPLGSATRRIKLGDWLFIEQKVGAIWRRTR